MNIAQDVPATVGTQSASVNLGEMNSWGIEVSLTWRDKIGKDIKYHIGINTGYSDNKVLNMSWATNYLYRQIVYGSRTDIGTWGQYHYGEADITVYINGINVASRHISYGGWSRNKDWNWVEISETKYPYPVQKKINIDYSENIDPKDESTQLVKISATDQYGVKWTTPASMPITVHNKSYPNQFQILKVCCNSRWFHLCYRGNMFDL